MSATAKALREQMAPLVAQTRQLADRYNADPAKWTPEDEANWTKLHNDYEALKARAERLEAVEKLERAMADPVNPDPPGREGTPSRRGKKERQRDQPSDEDRALAFQAWCRHQSGVALKKRHVEACKKTRLNPRSTYFDVALGSDYRQVRAIPRGDQQRAQSINLQTAGGYTIPQGFVPTLEVALLQYANVREWADVIRTESGNDLPHPTVNDTANKGSVLAENTQISELDLVFGQMVLHAYKYTSGLVQVPVELLEDSAFQLPVVLGNLLGIRFGRIQADHFTFGSGAGQPTGYITAATTGVTTASPTAIAADEIYDLKHSVDPAYRPGAVFTMHDLVKKYVKKLKDGFGRYLWQASLAGGAPDTLDGDPIGINQSMASAVSNNNVTMAYGQMSKYKIRDVNMVRMRRLVERYADFDQEGFVGFLRCDANLLDAGTHPIKVMVQHS